MMPNACRSRFSCYLPRCVLLFLGFAMLPALCAAQSAYDPNANGPVLALVMQPDGKLLVGGDFTTMGGANHFRLARLNVDGSADVDFAPPTIDSSVNAIAVQTDGRIVIGGTFTHVGATVRNHIARLNANGTLDGAYDPNVNGSFFTIVSALALQPDGKLMVGGGFLMIGGQARSCLARLNADGSVDAAFNPNANDLVWTLALQPDGKLVVGGNFTTIGNQPRNHLARLNVNGTLDDAFTPNTDSIVNALVLQPDGKLVVGGFFTTVDGQPRSDIARLYADGTLDTAFNPNANGGDFPTVYSLALQPDGDLVVVGSFNTIGGQTRNSVARLYTDGTLDETFDPNANGDIRDVALQSDGKLLVGGVFTMIGGDTRNNIARLNADGSVDNGGFCPQNFDGVAAPALPTGWTVSVSGAVSPWATSITSVDTSPNAVFADEPATITDNILISPSTLVTAANSKFYFRHSFNTETDFDGGEILISVDGFPFTELVAAGGVLAPGGYNVTINTVRGSPIAGKPAWSGNSRGFITTGVTLPSATFGHSVVIGWRATSDNSGGGTGWYIDSIRCGALPPTWSLATPYPIPILEQGTTRIGSVLYSFGGVSAHFQASSYRFDGTSWTAIAGLPVAAEAPAVASDGYYAYIVGGIAGGSTAITSMGYRYDPVANTYFSIALSPTATYGSAAVYLDGKIYKIAGVTGELGVSLSNAVEVYNIADNTWSTAAPFPSAVAFVGAFARDHFIYAAGGDDGSPQGSVKAYRYDPVTNLWDDSAFADLPQGRLGAASAAFHAGGLFAGGYVDGLVDANISATALQWNAWTNSWSPLPDMLQARALLGGGVVRGCFFAVGGRSPTGPGASFAGTTENQAFDCVFYDGFDP